MAERRETRQQAAIWAAMVRAGRPLSVDELFEHAAADLPGLGVRTVYRALRRWEDEHQVAPVTVPGQPARYEPAAVAAEHHHHFHCESCDRLFDIEGCPGRLDHLVPKGFQLRSHEITLQGLCDRCVPTPAKKPRR